MPDKKYSYNPNTLEFEKVGFSKTKKFIISSIAIFIGAIFIFMLIFLVFSYYYQARIKNNPHSEINILEKQYQELQKRKQQNNEFLKTLIEKDKKIYQIVFKSNPDQRNFIQNNPYKKILNADVNNISNKSKEKLDYIKNEKQKIINGYNKVLELAKNADIKILNKIPAIQPLYNKNFKYPVYGFGKRIDQVYKTLVPHPGIDYAAQKGTPVFATADGKIITAGNKRAYGKRIVIDHGNGYKTVYAHLASIDIRKGKKVKRGDKIGIVGMTGKALIPHLHYEIRYEEKPINPVNYFFLDLNAEEYYSIKIEATKSGLSLD